MSHKRFAVPIASVAAGLLLLSGCAGEGPGAYDGAGADPSPAAGDSGYDAPAAGGGSAAGPVTLGTTEVDGVGQVVTDQEGYTLYRFDKDTAKPPKSNCEGDCTKAWPPVLADGAVDVEGVDANMVGTVKRADGSEQVTVGGWPVYRYAKDTGSGEAKGQGVGGSWFAVNPTGGKAQAGTGSTAQGTGTRLLAGEAEGVGRVATDAEGFTLYMFSKDSKEPSTTTCEGDCATKWPPVLADGTVEVEGIDESLLGTVERPDGTQQVTLGGWPVYRFAKDTEPGQANGHGVGGTWFAMMPEGCKSAAPFQAGADKPADDNEGGGYNY